MRQAADHQRDQHLPRRQSRPQTGLLDGCQPLADRRRGEPVSRSGEEPVPEITKEPETDGRVGHQRREPCRSASVVNGRNGAEQGKVRVAKAPITSADVGNNHRARMGRMAAIGSR